MKKAFIPFAAASKITSRRIGLRNFASVAYKSDGDSGEETLEKQLNTLKTTLEGSLDEKAKKQVELQMKSIEASITKAKDEAKAEMQVKFDELKEQFNTLNAKAAEMLKTGAGGGQTKSFNEELKDGLTKGVKAWKEKGGNIEMQLKTAINTANFTTDASGSGNVIPAFREIGINKAPKRKPFIRPLAFNGTTTSDTVSWTEKVSESGVPINLAELAAYPEETSNYQQFSTAVKKIGGITKVSEEKLEDVDWMMNEIQAELVQRHDLVVDSQILSGDGTGQNLKGVLTYATAFAAGAFAAGVQAASIVDVLRVAYNQIVVALFEPNFIAMHPTDMALVELLKDSQNRYILPPFVSADGNMIKGLPVIENIGITQGTFLMGDSSRLGVFAKGGAVLEIGRDGSDFSTDQVTVKLRERLAVRIKGRDLAAFVKGTFATAITAITK